VVPSFSVRLINNRLSATPAAEGHCAHCRADRLRSMAFGGGSRFSNGATNGGPLVLHT
jgi:hypothetical protein